ncbi:hypothetical protein C8J56DRAFT_787482 [Mycena floridula]|nr:hypothetical protein C8J56DRAFT_787482 [Mycena floridula]
MSAQDEEGEDLIHKFLQQTQKIVQDAEFIVQSLPNVEPYSVERALRLLQTADHVLVNLHDPSTHNIRMERTWRDVRKDSLEIYRQIFTHLDDLDLLDMQNDVHRVCLYIVFQPRIQLSLDRTRTSWNLHRLRTEHAKTPTALYELSKAKAINRGYWTSDPGDDIFTASQPGYGRESEDQPLPPVEELVDDLARPDRTEFASSAEEHQAGVFVNDDDEITAGRELLQGLDVNEDDGNWGIDVYCRAVLLMERRMGIDNT